MLKRFSGASVFALAMACAGSSAAQEAPKSAGASAHMIDELVVTAQKREERLQEVPISVAAISGDTLVQQGINNLTELSTLVPGLNFTQSSSVRGEGFSVRGVGTAAFADAIEQSVATVVDGVSYARTGQAVTDLIDVARVEVLRGPQGFLFGKSASAGVISITTKRPTFTRVFEGAVSYATLNELKLSAVANLPLSSDLALRLAYSSTKADGTVENIFRHENLNNRDAQALRAKVLWQPNDAASLYLIGDWNKTDTRCCAWTYRSAPANTQLGQLNTAAGITPSPDNHEIASEQRFYQTDESVGLSVEANYNLGWATLTSVTGARDWRTANNNDPDLLPVNYIQVNGGQVHLMQKSEELRLTSPSGGRFEWLAGLYADRIQNQTSTNQAGQLLRNLPAGVVIGSAAQGTTVNRSAAVFGQASYRLTDKLKALVGMRYTDDVLMLDFRSYVSPGGIAPIGAIGLVKGRTETKNFSWRGTLQYDVTSDVMGYVTAARGYKGPGLNIIGTTGGVPSIVKPEIPTSYEAGVRSTLFGGAAIVNATAFSTTYKDYQAQVYDQTLIPATFRITNAGRLRTRGLELETLAKPTADMTINLSAAYIDGEYADFKNLSCYLGQPQLPVGTARTSPRQCIVISGTQAVTYGDGLPLINQPRLTYNVGVQQTWRVSDFKLVGRMNWSWRDKVNFTPNGDPGTAQGAYGLLAANLALSPEKGAWRVSLFAKNLLDQKFATFVFPSPVLGAAGVYAQFFSPNDRRIVGIMGELKY